MGRGGILRTSTDVCVFCFVSLIDEVSYLHSLLRTYAIVVSYFSFFFFPSFFSLRSLSSVGTP